MNLSIPSVDTQDNFFITLINQIKIIQNLLTISNIKYSKEIKCKKGNIDLNHLKEELIEYFQKTGEFFGNSFTSESKEFEELKFYLIDSAIATLKESGKAISDHYITKSIEIQLSTATDLNPTLVLDLEAIIGKYQH